MKLQTKQEIDAALPLAFFITDENRVAVAQHLPTTLSGATPALATYAAPDELHAFITPGAIAFFAGLGPAQGLQPEKLRKAMHKIIGRVQELKQEQLQVVLLGVKNHPHGEELLTAAVEAAVLSNYQFLLYRTERQKLLNRLESLIFITDVKDAAEVVNFAHHTAKATCVARDLVNEPPNVLTATELARRTEALGKKHGFKVEVLEKKKIEALRMGGLLAVNRGSLEPPTFTILEWKPRRPLNKQPIVLVGKGVTFDTGGLSLKPTQGSMDSMKSDMAGAAAVIGTFISLASNKLALHVVGLIPATDNRPGGDAFTPNDVITLQDGTTVEVLNTDAEGRLILADALAYAKQYEPQLVIDLATLTGAAVVAVGTQGIAMMSTASNELNAALLAAGERTHERLVQLPLWAEYREQLKSDIADLKNVGGRMAGAITAGKFLEHFTAYPWVHLDIAGPAYLEAADNYRGKNGTGVGVRLLTSFLQHYQE